MKSKITSKFQVTIPREIRSRLKLEVADSIEWKVEEGRVVVEPVSKPFLAYRGIIKVGRGDIRKDIGQARNKRVERFR
ncbi:MAG: AbrB/MazE/SpoVT family DNA-binding domain-containing protein [Spirochaetales bacterium]|nr:AbrB/MazE/SpoVT family DNA-binding domain-containing protein [Spirochaetales bacterium]